MPRLRVKPVVSPSPSGIVPPAAVPVMSMSLPRPLPGAFATWPMASVPSWQERQSLELLSTLQPTAPLSSGALTDSEV